MSCKQEFLNSFVYINNSTVRGLARFDTLEESGMLVVYSSNCEVPSGEGAKAQLAKQIVQDAIGHKIVDVEIITGEDWVASYESADRINLLHEISLILVIQNRRVFLAGDAARQMPPTGLWV